MVEKRIQKRGGSRNRLWLLGGRGALVPAGGWTRRVLEHPLWPGFLGSYLGKLGGEGTLQGSSGP